MTRPALFSTEKLYSTTRLLAKDYTVPSIDSKGGVTEELEEVLSMVWNDGAQLAGGAYITAPHYGLVTAMPKLQALFNKALIGRLEQIRSAGYDDMHKTYNYDKIVEALGESIQELS
jgi:hypothetical protein